MTSHALRSTATDRAPAKGRRNRSPKDSRYVYRRESKHNRTIHWWGDFRRFRDVGGKLERLSTYVEPGQTIQDDETARAVYWQAVALYLKRRAAVASGEPINLATTAAGTVSVVRAMPARASEAPAPSPARVIGGNAKDDSDRKKDDPAKPGQSPVEVAAELARLLHIKPPQGLELELATAAAAHLTRKREYAKIGDGQASTVDTDATSFKSLIRLLGGTTRLAAITPKMLQDYVTARLAEPGWKKGTLISAATVRNELHALSNLYTQLEEHDEYTLENPVRRVKKPAPSSEESEYLQLDEFARLLDAAAEEDDETSRAQRAMGLVHRARETGARGHARTAKAQRWLDEAEALYPTSIRGLGWHRRYPYVEALLAVLGYTGPRFEEGRGLLAQEVDWGRLEVVYRKNVYRGLKRADGVRRVPLVSEPARILRHHQTTSGIRSGLLLPGLGGDMAGSLQKVIARCVERAGIGRVITAHALRHTFATAMLHTYALSADGHLVQRSSFQVAKLLGHGDSEQVDDTYGHLLWNAGMMAEFSTDALRKYPSTRFET